ncbi:hypothetical protein G6O69_34655 [Pseudenhygromyxa sp. WMMC2535]|uniref:hypothetical protein n=1 Tax=Pseudenhygromyxa sp. WMMC2535 TaxID=2712867 RepID=UPI0015523EF8|nr:hypothetical protein [Pseudenhygromyxa sp. WMMC2535]NVB43015.1 hypothetical protein [Pseudenhygromyxa sp. WMMC2535]
MKDCTASSGTAELGPKTPPLERVPIKPGKMRVELQLNGGQRRSFGVLEFCPGEIIVDAFRPWATGGRVHARLEHVGPGGFVSQLRCQVVHAGATTSGGEPATRLRLLTAKRKQTQLRRYYREQCFPLLPRRDLDPREVLGLFERSGYLDLCRTRPRPSERWLRGDFSGELSSDFVYCAEDGALLGHVSVTRAYSRSWIGHQLTTLRGHEESLACRIALYKHFSMVPALHDGDEPHFLLGYYASSKRWHQLFFEGFVDWMDDASEVVAIPFERYSLIQGGTGPMLAANQRPGVVIDQPSPAALVEVSRFIAEFMPPLARAAFDIEAERLDRAFLAPSYAAHRLPRDRRVFSLRVDGRLLGVALCETGSEDMSLFDIFNLAQLYLVPGLPVELSRALVDFVRQYYRSRGHEHPLIVAAPGSLSSAVQQGLEYIETMGCMVWSGLSLPHYRRYLDECFAQIRPESLTGHAQEEGAVVRPAGAGRRGIERGQVLAGAAPQ